MKQFYRLLAYPGTDFVYFLHLCSGSPEIESGKGGFLLGCSDTSKKKKVVINQLREKVITGWGGQ